MTSNVLFGNPHPTENSLHLSTYNPFEARGERQPYLMKSPERIGLIIQQPGKQRQPLEDELMLKSSIEKRPLAPSANR